MKIKLSLDEGELYPRMSTLINTIVAALQARQLEYKITAIDPVSCEITLHRNARIPFPEKEGQCQP